MDIQLEISPIRNIISISRPSKDNIIYIFSLFNEKPNDEGDLKTGISLFPKSTVYFPILTKTKFHITFHEDSYIRGILKKKKIKLTY